MKTARKDQRAAVLVFAVLILTAGVFVLTAIAQLGATQALVGRDEWVLLDRRVTLQNSRAMARQFVLARMFRGAVSGTVEYSDSGLGAFEIQSTAALDYWTTPSIAQGGTNLKINPFNPMERGGFYPALLEASLSDGTNQVNWRFLVRTRSPIAAGYSYVQQYPATQPDLSSIFGAVNYVAVTNVGSDRHLHFVGDSASRGIPDVPVSSTTNTNANDTNGYQGSFAVPISAVALQDFAGGARVKSVDNPDNPTALRVVVNLAIDGFTLSASSGGLALRYALRDQETFTNSNSQTFTTNVTELEIEGSMDGPSQPPLLIVVTNHPYLTNVILSGSNLRDTGRRVYVQLKSPTNAVAFKASTNNTPSTYWRLGMSAKNCASLDFTGLGGVELVGGLRTDTNLPDLLNVVSEDDPGGVDYVADQMMWLEDYRVP